MKILRILLILVSILLVPNKSISIENRIVLKIGNEIISSLDIEKETRYLLSLNPNTRNLSKKQIYSISKNSLIREKIKKKEIVRHFDKMNVEQSTIDKFINNIINRINLNSKKEFQNYLRKNQLALGYVEEKIKIEILWNQLIYLKFNSKVKINLNEIKSQILKSKSLGTKKYFLQEILFDIKNNDNFENKYQLLQKNIEEQGFGRTALLFSVSDSSKNNGKIGWIEANSLNKNILNEIKNLGVGGVSKPITIPGGFLILKILDMKIEQKNIDVESELKKIKQSKTNQQLNQFSLIFYNKIKKNININEL